MLAFASPASYRDTAIVCSSANFHAFRDREQDIAGLIFVLLAADPRRIHGPIRHI